MTWKHWKTVILIQIQKKHLWLDASFDWIKCLKILSTLEWCSKSQNFQSRRHIFSQIRHNFHQKMTPFLAKRYHFSQKRHFWPKGIFLVKKIPFSVKKVPIFSEKRPRGLLSGWPYTNRCAKNNFVKGEFETGIGMEETACVLWSTSSN